jgi:anthranilate synthase/indole-3-glycerol phosphate synthase/phosphoribosylanthranilate isomerase
LDELIAMSPSHLVISPGPGHPTDAAISNQAIRHFAGKIPILGVCLGEQCIFEVFGGRVGSAGEIVHGKTSPIQHDQRGIFTGLAQGIQVTRYHSLAGDPKTVPDVLEVSATSANGVIMAVRHRGYTIEGVQFHPESIVSEGGRQLFANFLSYRSGKWEGNDSFVSPVGQATQTTQRTILEEIYEQRQCDVDELSSFPTQRLEDLERFIGLGLAPRTICIIDRLKQSKDGMPLIAEVKRASPSKGIIDLHANAPEQALKYAFSGASAISVLTEPKWFRGSINDLRLARHALDSLPLRPAILRKDFVFSRYQLIESRLNGADSVLIIVAMIKDAIKIKELIDCSRQLGMEPLVEVSTEKEMKIALSVGSRLIGVNNRNLHDFTVDMTNTNRLSSLVQSDDVFLVALSGIHARGDVEKFEQAGARAILVGESLMRSARKDTFIRSLTNSRSSKTFVKICGLTNEEDALKAAKLGATFLGFIHVPTSKRFIDHDVVKEMLEKLLRHHGRQLRPNKKHFSNVWISAMLLRTGDYSPLTVGVFQDQSFDDVKLIASDLRLDCVQLHGNESPEYCSKFNWQIVIKVFSITEEDNLKTVRDRIMPYLNYVSFILLDAKDGGSGKPFPWHVVRDLDFPFILAGGLNSDNVSTAINELQPMGVDVASGVEVEGQPGRKDLLRMQQFMQEATQ